MSGAHYSTAFSSFVVLVSSFLPGLALWYSDDSLPVEAFGFLVIASAAGLGVKRCMGKNPTLDLIQAQRSGAWFSSVVGYACISAGLHHKMVPGHWFLADYRLIAAATLMGVVTFLPPNVSGLAGVLVCLYNVISAGFLCGRNGNMAGVTGAVLNIFSGLVIGDEGTFLSVPRVDLHHYTVALGNYAFYFALTF